MFQSLQFMSTVIAGDHMLHVQNPYLLHILRMSLLRYTTVMIALWLYHLTIMRHL